MNINQSVESSEGVEVTAPARGQKVEDQASDQDACSAFPSPELIQRKYKCFIIYAISIISIIELILLMFSNDNSSSKSVLDVLARYVNRTQTMM